MNEADESELHRLCTELEQIDREHLSLSQREALKKAAIALSTAFAHDLRLAIERPVWNLKEVTRKLSLPVLSPCTGS
jgi:hypothetical protein